MENNVWIGFRAIILEGITIGENSIVGAGAVVTKNIPSNSIAMGILAKWKPLEMEVSPSSNPETNKV